MNFNPLENGEIIASLGTGSFSTIKCYKLKNKTSNIKENDLIAVKTYNRNDSIESGRSKYIINEKETMIRLQEIFSSSYIMKFFETKKDHMNVYFLFESILGGPLHKHINIGHNSRLHPRIASRYTAEIISALFFMSSRGVIHRDIKANNILLDSHGHIKICDFGSSKIICPVNKYDKIIEDGPFSIDLPRTFTIIGTIHCLAPEIISVSSLQNMQNRCGYSFQVDWWSLGVLVYEMMCGILPTTDNNIITTTTTSSSSSLLLSSCNEWLTDELILSAYNSINNIDTILSNKYKWGYNQLISYRCIDEEYLSSSPLLRAGKDFIKNCLELNPNNRYGPWKKKEIYSHEFFNYDDTNIDYNLVNNGTSDSPNIDFDKRLGFLDLIDDSECISQEEQNLFNDF